MPQQIDEGSFVPLQGAAQPNAQPNAQPAQAGAPASNSPVQAGQSDQSGLDPGSFTPISQVQQTAKPAIPPEQSTMSKIGDTAEDVGKGFVKSAGQTLTALSPVISKVFPGLVRPSDVEGIKAMTHPEGVGEMSGAALENVAEFFAGDEVFKALTTGAKYAKVGKIMDALTESPRLRRIIDYGIASIRQGIVAGGQSMFHGATVPEAATTGAEATGLGFAAGVGTDLATSVVKAGVKGVRRAVQAFTEPTAADTSAMATAAMRGIQPKVQSGLRSMMKGVEADGGIVTPKGATPEPPVEEQSIRDAVSKTADKFYSRAKDTYAKLDEASVGHFQRFDEALQEWKAEANKFISEPTEANMDAEAALFAKKASIEADMEATFERMRVDGVEPKTVESARQDFKKSMALYDLDFNVKRAAVQTSARPDIGLTAEEYAKNPELLHPSNMSGRLNKLYESGRLKEAVGSENANKMLREASNNFVQHQVTLDDAKAAAANRIRNNSRIRTGVKTAAAIAGLHELNSVTHVFTPGQGVQPVQ